MIRIKNQKHPIAILNYLGSRFLERLVHYAFRVLIILYLMDLFPDFTSNYALSTSIVPIFFVMGALLGDLLLGNRKTIIYGSVLQAIGLFVLASPLADALYIGLSLIVIGEGLYTPNLMANFGKTYYTKMKLLDSGFTLLYLLVNMAALIGAIFISLFIAKYGYSVSFVLLGFIMLGSMFLAFYTKEAQFQNDDAPKINFNTSYIALFAVFIIGAVYWMFYELAGKNISVVQNKMSELPALISFKNTIRNLSQDFNLILIPIAIGLILFWASFYYNKFVKLAIGLTLAALAYALLYTMPSITSDAPFFILLLILFLLVISELHITPIINSILIQYSPSKYAATIISIYLLIVYVVSMFGFKYLENNTTISSDVLLYGIVTLVALALGLIQFKRKLL